MVYDYLVIGAGSAGCAVAAHLSEDGAKKVLLLEAGPMDTEQHIHIPATFPYLFKTPLDWDYETTPQANCNNRQDYVPRGKAIGGSSSINAMVYMRGNPVNYDGWAAQGNEGWGWKDVLPYFMAMQNQERGASDFHGTGGPLNVANLRDPNPLSIAMVEAAMEQGYKQNDDFNDGEQEGFGLFQVTQTKGMRCSAAKAYLHPALERDNLTLETGALVKRLVIEDGRCTGALYTVDGEDRAAEAGLEVILSAGSIGSPQILMLSGVGPKAELEKHGIGVAKDLSGVGRNLQDHLMAPVAYHCTQPISLAGAGEPEEAEKLAQGMGMLTSNIGEAGGFLTVMDDAPAPDLQFHFAPGWFIHHGAGNPAEGHGFTLLPGVVGTRSVGALTLKSADPADKPLIDTNYFGERADLDVVVEGVKIARKILGSKAMDAYRGDEHLPGGSVRSDDEIREFVRTYAQNIYHPVGTCKMGNGADAVVDSGLRVHGIAGLRVADASIMPSIINANTNAVSILIGVKCAAMVVASA